ncbi:hypothetical protein KAI46_00910 [bacterium]|nr:hypothetical protein [bacterium]
MPKIQLSIIVLLLLLPLAAAAGLRYHFDGITPGYVCSAIKDQAKIKYPHSKNKQRYYMGKQEQCWKNIHDLFSVSELKEKKLKNIKHLAAIEWPDDYKMQYHLIRKQIAAWRKFKDFKQPENFHSGFRFLQLKKEYKKKYPNNYETRLGEFKRRLLEDL